MNVTLDDIVRARERIHASVFHTPLVRSDSLSEQADAQVYLKLEMTQQIGAFKIRGATNRIASLDPQTCAGVVTVSTGNHGRAVAAAAATAGIRAVVCMSSLVPDNKRQAVESLGAQVRIVGRSQDEAEIEANRLVTEERMVMVHPFDDPQVIAGQGTIGLEILDDLPGVDMVFAGLSGGGLLGGIAIAIKAANSHARMVGVSMQRGPAMVRSLEAGRPVEVAEEVSLADSLGGGIGLDNRHSFEIVRRFVDETVLVSEVEIADGMRHLYFKEALVAEGAGAVGVAALLHEKVPVQGTKVVLIVSGRNVDMREFTRIVDRKD
jgi:threonine dehydratase